MKLLRSRLYEYELEKKKIEELKKKLKDRKKAHQKMIDDIDKGLQKLEKKTGG